MPVLVKAYQCSYGCGYCRKGRGSVIAHEKRCFHNPKSKACQTCGFFSVEWETFYNPYHGGDPGSTDYDYKVRYCRFLEEGPLELRRDCENWKSKEAG